MKNSVSNRLNSVEESKSVKLAAVIADLRAQGKKVISFNVGEPDFDTPKVVLEATKKALDEGMTKYALVPGQVFLRTAIADKLNRDQSLDLNAGNILISNGSKQILYSLFQALINEGEECIIPAPYWVSFPEGVKLAGAVPVFPNSNGEEISLDHIKKAITSKTRAIIINSPNNPSGKVFTKDFFSKVHELCRENNLYLISDEAYESLIFNDSGHCFPATAGDKNLDHTIIVQSFSKSFCMTGFRVGYAAANKEVIAALSKLQSHVCGNIPVFIQKGAEVALQHEEEIKKNMVTTFKKRANLAYELCKEIFPLTTPSEGAFYLFPKIQDELVAKYGNDENLALHILEKAQVAILPGSYFGCPNHLRICFSASEEEITAGFKAIKECL